MKKIQKTASTIPMKVSNDPKVVRRVCREMADLLLAPTGNVIRFHLSLILNNEDSRRAFAEELRRRVLVRLVLESDGKTTRIVRRVDLK